MSLFLSGLLFSLLRAFMQFLIVYTYGHEQFLLCIFCKNLNTSLQHNQKRKHVLLDFFISRKLQCFTWFFKPQSKTTLRKHVSKTFFLMVGSKNRWLWRAFSVWGAVLNIRQLYINSFGHWGALLQTKHLFLYDMWTPKQQIHMFSSRTMKAQQAKPQHYDQLFPLLSGARYEHTLTAKIFAKSILQKNASFMFQEFTTHETLLLGSRKLREIFKNVHYIRNGWRAFVQ